jgi:hypothetical protein
LEVVRLPVVHLAPKLVADLGQVLLVDSEEQQPVDPLLVGEEVEVRLARNRRSVEAEVRSARNPRLVEEEVHSEEEEQQVVRLVRNLRLEEEEEVRSGEAGEEEDSVRNPLGVSLAVRPAARAALARLQEEPVALVPQREEEASAEEAPVALVEPRVALVHSGRNLPLAQPVAEAVPLAVEPRTLEVVSVAQRVEVEVASLGVVRRRVALVPRPPVVLAHPQPVVLVPPVEVLALAEQREVEVASVRNQQVVDSLVVVPLVEVALVVQEEEQRVEVALVALARNRRPPREVAVALAGSVDSVEARNPRAVAVSLVVEQVAQQGEEVALAASERNPRVVVASLVVRVRLVVRHPVALVDSAQLAVLVVRHPVALVALVVRLVGLRHQVALVALVRLAVRLAGALRPCLAVRLAVRDLVALVALVLLVLARLVPWLALLLHPRRLHLHRCRRRLHRSTFVRSVPRPRCPPSTMARTLQPHCEPRKSRRPRRRPRRHLAHLPRRSLHPLPLRLRLASVRLRLPHPRPPSAVAVATTSAPTRPPLELRPPSRSDHVRFGLRPTPCLPVRTRSPS